MKTRLRAALFSAFILLLGAAFAPGGVCFAAPAIAAPALPKQAVVTGKVVMPDGQPAAGQR